MPSSKLLLFLILLVLFGLFKCGSRGLRYRLDKTIKPLLYDIYVKPYLLPEDGNKQFTFDGEVKIKLAATAADIDRITLHKDFIEITNAWLYDEYGQHIQSFNMSEMIFEVATDKLTVPLKEPLSRNATYTLHCVYKGTIRNDFTGLFRANYTDKFGKLKWIAATHLEYTYARRLLPCFDEPSFKAKFRMHISRPSHYISLFNTRLLTFEQDGENRIVDHFKETPLMSTYLVALLVSDFVKRGTADYNILVRPELIKGTDLAYSIGLKAILAFDEHTKLPYKELGNPNMQIVGLPIFPYKAMDNWGLIICQEPAVVQIPSYTDGWNDNQNTLTTLFYEIAHMWFGNSVTPEWWSYFWINEAFASYYQYFMAHKHYSEYQLDQQFIVKQTHYVFNIDAMASALALTSHIDAIQTPAEIRKNSNIITYAKGACIVHMIRNAMGGNNFDRAIQGYLKENQLLNTVPSDLFKHLKIYWPKIQEVNLKDFFHDWTEQAGYPLLNVTIFNDGYSISLSQTRFLLGKYSKDDPLTFLEYTIPITYTTSVEKNFDTLTPNFYFNKTFNTMSWHFKNQVKWVIFNLQQVNYYRVYYDAITLFHIRETLKEPGFGGIHVINRAQLINDVFSFGRAGMIKYDRVFAFLEYLEKETEYLPWHAAFTGFQYISQRLPLQRQNDFANYLFNITDRVFHRLVFQNDTEKVLEIYKRNEVLSWWCKYKHSKCLKYTIEIFDESQRNQEKPPADLREMIYCSALKETSFSYYFLLEELYEVEPHEAERELLLRAMGCTVHFTHHHYGRILSKDVPRKFKVAAFKSMYIENPENVVPVFTMVTTTIESFAKSLGGWQEAANAISDLSEYFTTSKQLNEFEKFIVEKKKQFGPSTKTLYKAHAKVKENIEWSEKHFEHLYRYLEDRSNSATITLSNSLFLIANLLFYFIQIC